MGDNGNVPNPGDRKIEVLLGKDEGKDFSTITVKDVDSLTVLMNIAVPDAAVIDQTYKLGGEALPLEAIHSICSISFFSILQMLEIGVEETKKDDQPPQD